MFHYLLVLETPSTSSPLFEELCMVLGVVKLFLRPEGHKGSENFAFLCAAQAELYEMVLVSVIVNEC